MPNVRIRGKIPRDEWPKIALRFQKGETLTEIARSYGCTAPAIRYIVGRISAGGAKRKMGRDRLEKGTLLAPPLENRRTTRIVGKDEDSRYVGRGGFSPSSPTREVWGRINSDITMFLVAMDFTFLRRQREQLRGVAGCDRSAAVGNRAHTLGTGAHPRQPKEDVFDPSHLGLIAPAPAMGPAAAPAGPFAAGRGCRYPAACL